MALLYVSEYRRAHFAGQASDIPTAPALRTQRVSFTGTAGVIANAIGKDTEIVKVVADAACAIRFGADPTAVVTDDMLPANTPLIMAVPNDGTLKISAIALA